MHPVLATFRYSIEVLRDLILKVWARDRGVAERPAYARKAVAERLARGIRIAEAYLRRLLIVMALELEPALVDRPRKPLARKKAGKFRLRSPVTFRVLDESYSPITDRVVDVWTTSRRKRRHQLRQAERKVSMTRLYLRLDLVRKIANTPLPHASRFAYHLARSREGVICAPDRGLRIPGRWGTEPSMMFNFLGYEIIPRGKERPPPLPPRQTRGPKATWL